MNKDLTNRLVKRFPVLYQDYSSPMSQTCMCWGFDHGDGWFEIIWQLSLAIEDHLGYSSAQKHWFIFKKGFFRKWNDLIYKISPVARDKTKMEGTGKTGDPYRQVVIEKARPRLPWVKKFVSWPYTGFSVQQVKEKYGTLRFYCGGDETIDKYVNLACALSEITCEVCGKPAKLDSTGGWYSVVCTPCKAQSKK